jgi:hypothetical protein
MKTIRNGYFTFGVLLCSAFCLRAAQPPTTSVNVTGVEGPVMGGVYTDPYQATLGGVSGVNVICDDYNDNSYIGESWTAYAINLGSLSTYSSDAYYTKSDPSLGSEDGVNFTNDAILNQTQAYATAAVLAEDILATNQSTQSGQTTAGELSYALWGIFDWQALNPTYDGGLTSAELSAAKTYLVNAGNLVLQDNLTANNFSNVTLYSWNSALGTPQGCPGICAQPQELLTVQMAEPPAPALLGADLLVIAGLFVLLRRRMVRG